MDRVKLNVSGTIFEFDKKLLKEGKSAKLRKICSRSEEIGKLLEVTVDCSPLGFSSILAYLQMGELHIPPGVCPGAFRRELDFWEVDYDCLHECCMFRYQSFLDEEKMRKEFFHKTHPVKTTVAPVSVLPVSGCASKCKSKLWAVIDNNENSLPAKLYFIMISTLVVVSVFVMAYSTEPYNRRRVSKCELLDYMKRTQPSTVERIRNIIGNPNCTGGGSWWISTNWDYEDLLDLDDYNWDDGSDSLDTGDGNKTSKPTKNSPVTLVNTSQTPSSVNPVNTSQTLSSVTPVNTSQTPSSVTPVNTSQTPSDNQEYQQEVMVKPIRIPLLSLPKPIFNILDITVNIVFTVDFLLRILSCPSIRLYFSSVINALDCLALIATYIYIIIVSVERQYLYEETPSLMLLNFAQVFRALRLFRVVKNVRASTVLAYALQRDVKDMSLLVTLLFVGVSSFAYLFYFAETRDTVTSIPNAWYWAIVSMTTVGYGDISPKTGFGRFISSLCAISGVLLLSITLPMFVNNFLTLYQYSCVNESIQNMKSIQRKSIKNQCNTFQCKRRRPQ